METLSHQFIRFAIESNVLRFGEFTLKSGRVSPYFYNAGLFNTGEQLRKLGQFYAHALYDSDIDIDILFGPAYKGIPLATSTAIALAEHYEQNISYAFNRKEVKDHGEGGQIVGADLKNKKVVIIDDVITAGTAIGDSMPILSKHGANLSGIVISFNRQERGNQSISAIKEIELKYNVPVISICTLQQLISYLATQPDKADILTQIEAYHAKYGA